MLVNGNVLPNRLFFFSFSEIKREVLAIVWVGSEAITRRVEYSYSCYSCSGIGVRNLLQIFYCMCALLQVYGIVMALSILQLYMFWFVKTWLAGWLACHCWLQLMKRHVNIWSKTRNFVKFVCFNQICNIN